jgi:hypothetical protein
MVDTIYCYHCRMHHPKEEMRQVDCKIGKRWRCIKSIEATKRGQDARVAFGQRTSAINKADSQSIRRMQGNSEFFTRGK